MHGPNSTTRILVAFMGLCLSASSANAGDAACLWKGLPQSYRTAFFAAYPTKGQGALEDLNPPGEVFGAIMVGCGVRNHEQVAAAVNALAAYSLDEGAARLLRDRFGIERSQIDAAWEGLPADRREAFFRSVLPGAENGMPATSTDPSLRESARSIVQGIARTLNINDSAMSDQVGVYLVWKVVRPLYEAKF